MTQQNNPAEAAAMIDAVLRRGLMVSHQWNWK